MGGSAYTWMYTSIAPQPKKHKAFSQIFVIFFKKAPQAAKNMKIGSAGLDVYEEESEYFYEDQSDRIIDDDVLARLLSFNNVIVTSHQAFFTREATGNIAMTTLQNIKDFINHKSLLNEVKR